MADLGRYCKAFPVSTLASFSGWSEAVSAGGDEHEYLFLQETFVVTTGPFIDEGVVFDKVSPEWEAFCLNELKFATPDDVLEMEPLTAAQSGS